MPNTLLTNDEVAMAALDPFENELRAVKMCSRTLESGFGQKGAQRGDSVRIRKPGQFTVRSGSAWAGQNVTEEFETLVLDYQKGIDGSMTSKERKLDLHNMQRQILKPAMIRLANEVDKDIIEVVSRATFNAVGTPGTTPSTMQTYIDAGVLLSNFGAPRGNRQRNLLINPEMEGDIAFALRDYFNPGRKISGIFDAAEMDGLYASGLNWHMDQNVYTHTVGAYAGTPRVNGASQSGASLITDGWSADASDLNEGDRFTIADVFAVNPVTKATLADLQQFVVTADTDDAAGAMTIAISPSITGPGSALQNVSALPANDALITVFGTTGNVYSQGICWNEDAVTFAMVPLDKPEGVNAASMKYDEQSGAGLRYIEWYDGDTDLWKFRFDCVYGLKVIRPEWTVAVAAA